ncbi:MAG: hypothetical protein F6K26_30915 [Moorea sp. SIO2I5]|nr:hypothetical protein [Moorena sp. SIO2I5]
MRYGTGCLNPGQSAKNPGEPVPNAPYGYQLTVEWASWWNWHQASYNIFSRGQDAHSTPIDWKIQQPHN